MPNPTPPAFISVFKEKENLVKIRGIKNVKHLHVCFWDESVMRFKLDYHVTVIVIAKETNNSRKIRIQQDDLNLDISRDLKFTDEENEKINCFHDQKKLVRHTDEGQLDVSKIIFNKMFGSTTSVVRVMGPKKHYYAQKEEKIAQGGFSHIKMALIYDADGNIVYDNVVLRSSKWETPKIVVRFNCDHALFRAMRDKPIKGKPNVKKSYTVLKKGYCNLAEYIKKIEGKDAVGFSLKNRKLALQVAIAIAQLIYQYHLNGMAHCDIKPGNILLRSNDDMTKIISLVLIDMDFVLSTENYIDEICGTQGYRLEYSVKGEWQDIHAFFQTLYFIQPGRNKIDTVSIFSKAIFDSLSLPLKKLLNINDYGKYDIKHILCALLAEYFSKTYQYSEKSANQLFSEAEEKLGKSGDFCYQIELPLPKSLAVAQLRAHNPQGFFYDQAERVPLVANQLREKENQGCPCAAM